MFHIMYITHYGTEGFVLIINMMKETLATRTFVIQNLNFHIYRVIQLFEARHNTLSTIFKLRGFINVKRALPEPSI
jgi:hypothetical protein